MTVEPPVQVPRGSGRVVQLRPERVGRRHREAADEVGAQVRGGGGSGHAVREQLEARGGPRARGRLRIR